MKEKNKNMNNMKTKQQEQENKVAEKKGVIRMKKNCN